MRRRNTRRAVVVVTIAIGAMAVAACNTESGTAPAMTLAVGNTVGSLQLADADAPAPPLPEPGQDDGIPTTLPGGTPLGTCRVDVSGDETDAWSAVADDESITFGDWLNSIARAEAAANSIPFDPGYFLLNCRGQGDRSVSFTGNDTIRQRATTYRFTLGSDGQPAAGNTMAVVLALEPHGVCTLGGNGSLVIDEFDDAIITGSFDVAFICDDETAVQATGRFAYERPEDPPPPADTQPGTSTTTG